jgi:hypothetical protein
MKNRADKIGEDALQDTVDLCAALAEAWGLDPRNLRPLLKEHDESGSRCRCKICRIDVGAKDLYLLILETQSVGTDEARRHEREERLKSAPGPFCEQLKRTAQELDRLLKMVEVPESRYRGILDSIAYRDCGRTVSAATLAGWADTFSVRDEPDLLSNAIYTFSAGWIDLADTVVTGWVDILSKAACVAEMLEIRADYAPSVKRWPKHVKHALGIERGRGRPRDLPTHRLFYNTARVYHELTGRKPTGLETSRDREHNGKFGPTGPLWVLCTRVWKVCWPGVAGDAIRGNRRSRG